MRHGGGRYGREGEPKTGKQVQQRSSSILGFLEKSQDIKRSHEPSCIKLANWKGRPSLRSVARFVADRKEKSNGNEENLDGNPRLEINGEERHENFRYGNDIIESVDPKDPPQGDHYDRDISCNDFALVSSVQRYNIATTRVSTITLTMQK